MIEFINSEKKEITLCGVKYLNEFQSKDQYGRYIKYPTMAKAPRVKINAYCCKTPF